MKRKQETQEKPWNYQGRGERNSGGEENEIPPLMTQFLNFTLFTHCPFLRGGEVEGIKKHFYLFIYLFEVATGTENASKNLIFLYSFLTVISSSRVQCSLPQAKSREN